MSFEWQLLLTRTPPPFGSDVWSLVALPSVNGLLRYGFQVVVDADTPVTWNTCGFFGVVQGVAGRGVISRTHPIPLIGPRADPVLRVLGAGDFDTVTQGAESLSLVYCVNRWVSAESLKLYGLVDV